MKFTAGTFLVLLLAGVHGWEDVDEECVQELNLDKPTIQAINDQDKYPEDDVDFNSFLACTGRKEKVIKDGELDWKEIGRIFQAQIEKAMGNATTFEGLVAAVLLEGIYKTCKEKNIQGDSDGQTMAKLYNCLKFRFPSNGR